MKLAYAVLFLGIAVIIIYIAFQNRKDERGFVKTLGKLCVCTGICAIANFFMLSDQETVSYFSHTVFYATIDFVLMYFSIFSYDYTEIPFPKKFNYAIHFLMITDAVSIMLSNIFHHEFTLYSMEAGGQIYYRMNGSSFYSCHLAICYLMCFGVVMNFLYKCLHSSIYYRKKYIMMILIFLGILAIDVGYMFATDLPANLGIASYALGVMIINYYTVIYVPSGVTNETIRRVVSDIDEALLIFDADGNCIFANEYSRRVMMEKGGIRFAEDLLNSFHEKYPDLRKEVDDIPYQLALADGIHFYRASYFPFIDEIGELGGCFFRITDMTESIRKNQEEHYRATHDSLTGLYNKEAFMEACSRKFELYPKEEFYMVVSDIDNFKMVNDIFGSGTGDQLLCHIADVMESHSKQEVYGRLAGDRFGLLVAKKSYDEALFQQIVQEMSAYGKEDIFPISIHVGCYEVTDKSLPVSGMIDRASLAMSTIKGDFSQHFAFYDEEMRDELFRSQELLADLDGAIRREEFIIYLQPQVDADQKTTGAEALVRWQHPKRGLLFPGDFVPLFEHNGVITHMDIAVWEAACKTLKRWKEQGWEDYYISINISARDLHFADIYRILTELVEKHEISPQNLKLEITESALMVNIEKQLELLGKLKDYGFTIEMDDFGSGYSSLNMLNRTNLDVLKIDLAFLNRSNNTEKSFKIIRTIAQMAEELGMESIMEGVETEAEYLRLKEAGIKMFQGYYFAKPMPVAEFEERYLKG